MRWDFSFQFSEDWKKIEKCTLGRIYKKGRGKDVIGDYGKDLTRYHGESTEPQAHGRNQPHDQKNQGRICGAENCRKEKETTDQFFCRRC